MGLLYLFVLVDADFGAQRVLRWMGSGLRRAPAGWVRPDHARDGNGAWEPDAIVMGRAALRGRTDPSPTTGR